MGKLKSLFVLVQQKILNNIWFGSDTYWYDYVLHIVTIAVTWLAAYIIIKGQYAVFMAAIPITIFLLSVFSLGIKVNQLLHRKTRSALGLEHALELLIDAIERKHPEYTTQITICNVGAFYMKKHVAEYMLAYYSTHPVANTPEFRIMLKMCKKRGMICVA